MIDRIKNYFGKVRTNMGLGQELRSIKDHPAINYDPEMLKYINEWFKLYQGYLPKIHDAEVFTIEKGRTKRRKKTMGMPKVIAQEMASLIFNEQCQISVNDGEDEVSQYVEDVLNDNNFQKKFQDHLEYQFALGGMMVKPYYSSKHRKIKLGYVTAQSFIPVTWDNDDILEAVFLHEQFRQENGKRVKYTLLEWHLESTHEEQNGYTIYNELYRTEKLEQLGKRIPLHTMYPDLEETIGIHPLQRPLFVYIKPNTANNLFLDQPLGISLYANAIDTLELIDTAFDSYLREFRLGKKRILIPESMVKTVYDPFSDTTNRYFDTNDEIYEAVDRGEMDDTKISDISVEIRAEEHIASINAMLNWLSMQTGFSPGTFSFDGQSVKTATEVISENSKTFKSKQSHENLVAAGITQLVKTILILSDLYGVEGTPEYDLQELQVRVAFDDSIAEDANAEAQKILALKAGGLISTVRAIEIVQGVTREEAEEIMAEIQQEEHDRLIDPPSSAYFGEFE